MAIGAAQVLGRIELPLHDLAVPARFSLEVRVPTASGVAVNDWGLWVYHQKVDTTPAAPDGVLVTDDLHDAARERLAAGGTVWLTIPPSRVAPDPRRGPVAIGFSSIFWNTAWTNGQAPHTLGILCDPEHPALADFPTAFHSDWQWWYVMSHAGAMILDDLPQPLRPIVQVIDDWVTNRKLGLVWEARVGPGRLLVTSVDLSGELDPVRRQLRTSLLNYADSEAFAPPQSADLETVTALIAAEAASVQP